MSWAWDQFTDSFSSIHNRVAEDTIHTWTAQQTSPLNNNGISQAQVQSAIRGLDARCYQNNGTNYCNLATVDVAETFNADFAVEISIEIPGQTFEGAGLVIRWSSGAWFLATLAKSASGDWIVTLAKETVATLSRPALVQENLGPGFGPFYSWVKVVGRGPVLELWLAEGNITNSVPAFPLKNYAKIGEALDTTNQASIKHGICLYYSSGYAANPFGSGFGIDNFDVSEAPVLSTARPLLRQRQRAA